MTVMTRLVAVASLSITLTASALAQGAGSQYAVREGATVDVPRSLFGSSPSEEVKAQARDQAFESAWRNYIAATSTGARAQLYLKHAEALRRLAPQLCNVRVTNELFDDKASKYSVELRGSCDNRATEAALSRLNGSTQAAAAGGDKPGFTFVFLARRAADATTFLDKSSVERSVTVETTGSETASDSSRSSGGNSSSRSAEGGAVTQTERREQKGTIAQRDTAYKFKVEQSEGVDNAVTNVLTTAGYDVVKYSDVLGACPVGPKLDEVVHNFADPKPDQAELVPADLRRRMIDAARHEDCRMSFFAVGLLDMLKAESRPDGLVRVTVALTMDVRDIRKRLPTAVAAIPAAQFQALGKDRIEAANNALRMAAERGTQEVVDMLRQRDL